MLTPPEGYPDIEVNIPPKIVESRRDEQEEQKAFCQNPDDEVSIAYSVAAALTVSWVEELVAARFAAARKKEIEQLDLYEEEDGYHLERS